MAIADPKQAPGGLITGAAGVRAKVDQELRFQIGTVWVRLRSGQARTVGAFATEANKVTEWSALNWSYMGQDIEPSFAAIANLAVPAGFRIVETLTVYTRNTTGIAGANLAADTANWTQRTATPSFGRAPIGTLVALDAATVVAGELITVLDVGVAGPKFCTFLFPTAGLGNQTNRSLVATDQIMSNSNFSTNVSADLVTPNQNYTVQTYTITSPVGAKRAAVSAWAMFADESTGSQLVRFWFTMTKVAGSVNVFSGAARVRGSITGGVNGGIDERTLSLFINDSEITVESATQYRVDVIAQKGYSTGPTTFREGLIKIDWRG